MIVGDGRSHRVPGTEIDDAGSNRAARCRYLCCDPRRPLRPHRGGGGRARLDRGRRAVTALPAGGRQKVLAPHWLAAADRIRLADLVRAALDSATVHPVAAIHLEDVLTELHLATARDAVWPSSAARVRMATGWGADVLPIRLSEAELASVLALPGVPHELRDALGRGQGPGGGAA
jgi:hypothetical protein